MAIFLTPFKWLFAGRAFAGAEAGSQQPLNEEERRAAREVVLEQLGLAQWAGFTHL